MQRLADGVYGVVSANARVVELRSLKDATVFPLRVEDAPQLRRLALGLPGSGALFESLRSRKLAVQTPRNADAHFSRALLEAGAAFRWRVGKDTQAVKAVQRVRCAMKLVEDPWRAALAVPENVVARLQQLPLKGRVLVLGDAAQTSVALAALRAHTTVVESNPDLAAFLRRHTARMAHAPTVVHADVTQPVDPSWVGAFSLVLVESPSVAGALRALLDRAALFCRKGGTVSLLAPTSSARHVEAAASRVGLQPVSAMREHTHVLLPGLVPSPLRLDHHVMLANGGACTPAHDACEWADTPPGSPERDDMAHFDVVLPGLRWDRLQPRLQAALDAVGAVSVDEKTVASGKYIHHFRAFAGGGHLATVHNQETGLLALDVFPFHQALQDALCHMLLALVPPQRRTGSTSPR